MDSALRAAIEKHAVVDISTHGRKSGATRRIDIRLGYADRRIFMALVLSAASDRELDEP